MAAKKKKSVTKSAAVAKTIETSVSNLSSAKEQAGAAVTARAAESKSLLGEIKKLKKRRVTQMNKKKRAVASDKKNSTADSRKMVKAATSDITATTKDTAKATANRQAVLAELAGLKTSLKQVNAYIKSIAAADKQLAKKPARRSAKKKAKLD